MSRVMLPALGMAAVLLGACTQPAAPSASAPTAVRPSPADTAPRAEATAAISSAPPPATQTPGALPTVLVHKSPTCGCCTAWVEHMRKAGFTVQIDETEALDPIRQRLGVPFGKGSCHTAEIDGLVVEGHVPAEDVKRLLANRGEARGLVLPGMPLGSPGMEMPDGRVQRYTVERINADGTTAPFATHGE